MKKDQRIPSVDDVRKRYGHPLSTLDIKNEKSYCVLGAFLLSWRGRTCDYRFPTVDDACSVLQVAGIRPTPAMVKVMRRIIAKNDSRKFDQAWAELDKLVGLLKREGQN